MDTLKALNDLSSGAARLASKCYEHEKAAESLAKKRNSEDTLVEIIVEMGKNNYSWEQLPREALFEVINECKLDLIRLAELRLAAKARELKIKAAQRNAIVVASILPLPEISKE